MEASNLCLVMVPFESRSILALPQEEKIKSLNLSTNFLFSVMYLVSFLLRFLVKLHEFNYQLKVKAVFDK